MADPIFNLVKSLTKQEKIFFKRQAEISGRKEPTYIKLFNAMDSMDEYEEAKLRKKLKNPPWWKRIGYERLYLKNALLDSLSIYNSNRKTTDPIATVEAQVKRELNHVQVLREKHQTELALKLINKVIEDAAKHELYSYWQMALHLKQFIVYDSNADLETKNEVHRDALKQQLDAIEQQKQIVQLKVVATQSWEKLQQAGLSFNEQVEKELREVLANPLLDDAYETLSVTARGIKLSIAATIHSRLGDKEKNLELRKQEIDLMEKNIHFYPFRRRISLHVNLIAAYIQNGKVEEGNNAADKYFQIKCHSDFERQAHFGEGCGSIIPYLVSAGQYDKAIEMAEEIKDFLENDGGFLDSLRQLNIYMAYISMYVVLGEYEKAIEWQALQLNVPWAPGIDDMRLTCYLFHLIAHYELGNFALIESLCRSAQRKLGDKSFPTQTERIVTRFIQKVPSPSEEQQHWQDFKAALQEVKMNSGEDRKYHFLDFELWVESKIQGQPLIELVNAQSV